MTFRRIGFQKYCLHFNLSFVPISYSYYLPWYKNSLLFTFFLRPSVCCCQFCHATKLSTLHYQARLKQGIYKEMSAHCSKEYPDTGYRSRTYINAPRPRRCNILLYLFQFQEKNHNL